MFRKTKNKIKFYILIITTISTLFGLNFKNYINDNSNIVTVKQVVDGDTIKAYDKNNNEITIRLIGVDTPESVHPNKSKNTKAGKIASDYVKNLIKKDSAIKIEYDVQEKDKYQRHLCYVYFKQNGNWIMLNKHLLEKGYAKILTIPPNIKYADDFKNIQK